MRLNALAIMEAEKLLDKPFSDFDFMDEETMKTLAYCMHVGNGKSYTKEEFDNIFKLKGGDKVLKPVIAEIKYLMQFSKQGEQEEYKEKVWVTQLINRLIMLGRVNQSYILKEMRLWELEELLKASEEHVREEMEQRRFWAYVAIIPHIDTKKIKSPSDFMPFPWEAEDVKKEGLADLERDKEMFYKFINSKPLKS